MSQKKASTRKSFPLSLRISLWLIVAAILPLFVALVVSELQSRPTLIDQASRTMETDAQTHAQLIENYLTAKLLEARTLDNTPIVQQYFADPVHNKAALAVVIQNGLAINKSNDPDIMLVTHYNIQGHYLFSYSIYGMKPQPHGKYLIPPADLQNLAKSKTLQYVSDVYYDPVLRQSTIEIYTTVYSVALKKPVGIIRDTLSLDIVTRIVNSEEGANGSGSYAFILDQNGVRVIDPDPSVLFTSVAPLSTQIQQNMRDENRYGTDSPVRVLADDNLNHIQGQGQPPTTFQEVPAGANELFQVTRHALSAVPWTYFVLTPVNVVVAVANQQLLIITLIALLILVPAAVVGWIVGNRVSSPVLHAVESLVGSSHALNQLSEREKNAASEQIWVVDSSMAGLRSVQYYTDASKIAVGQLNELGRSLLLQRQMDRQSILQGVAEMVNIGQYFETAIAYQDESNKKVAVAVKVTNEVAMQLESGANSASEAANELDHVVNQLRRIVGK